MQPEPGEEILFDGHPSWLALLGLYAKGLIGALAAGVAAGIASALAGGSVNSVWVIAAVAVVVVAVLAVAQLRRIQTTYSITSRRLTIETGLLAKDLHQTRLERIQNVTARQSLLERALGIGTVDFDTAGETQFDFSFRGVADPRGIVRTVDRSLQELHERGGWVLPGADV